MRWRGGRRSSNVEDRRGRRTGGVPVKGGLGLVIVVLAAACFGVDPAIILNQALQTGGDAGPAGDYRPSAAEQELADFTAVVLADTEDTWHALFNAAGERYAEPKLVLFSGAVRSGCGNAQSAMGPFYCPADNKVYIDLSFYRDLRERHGAPGDFAQA
tara:strand:+ start:3918 stop:4391 length:474 start_codon:yes stop_codon:yes gene_type:complete